VVVSPSFLVKYNPSSDIQADFNTNLILNNTLLFGLSYRLERSLVTIIQYYITPQLKLGYSYDFVFYDIGKHNYGTHEIAVRYEFGYTVDISTPRRF
jgi:type IX secretion system PorP/SprF family membrane protein